ncbi:ABC transporter permease [Desulfoluna spongiiphila]|uniref:ABC-type transport system, involved in lipoprotein release, permease component n=1 Tax=Desulfoluna spongiiphila TaxID=419481 RepID=A0A1G5J4P6_9BACT|nr:ABC transporter permease [Desulfoluna spongiiphila]SCY83326.1 ABC-type transport system, involved in lipoprotein release, permease component [Desulfoluna spongiiphila]
MHSELAWRNIWRNPRRTLVITTAVVIGIWSIILLSALTRGMQREMLANGIKTLTGHIQIQNPRYIDDPVVDYVLDAQPFKAETLFTDLPAGSHWTGRIRVGAVAANARHSGGVTLVGMDPMREPSVSFIGGAVTEGRPLTASDRNKVVVGRALLTTYEARIGHKLILMSQDATGEIASKAFRIVGIFDADMEATEKTYLFVPLEAAQQMLGLGDKLSEVSILLPAMEGERATADILTAALGDETLTVTTWQERLPMLAAYLKLSDSFIYIWYGVVFIAMGFGIVNTTLMAVFERIREFGLVRALGMSPSGIVRGVILESLFLLLMGLAAGNLLGIATVSLIAIHGIDLSALAAGTEMWGMPRIIIPLLTPTDILTANGVIVTLGLAVSLYPATKAARITPVEALRYT